MRSFYRSLHVDSNWIRLGYNRRFNKATGKLINISSRSPNLLIIGSQKCGTTSLFFYLKKHPQIAESTPFKEPGYFIFDNWARDFWKRTKNIHLRSKQQLKAHYMSKNLTDQKYFMDASTYYTQFKNESLYDIPQQIYKESPDAKLIFIIRNPFQRLISVFYHQKRQGNLLDFNACVNHDWHIKTSLFYDRVKPYMQKFGKDNIWILEMEDLQNNPNHVLHNLWSFLEIEPIMIDDIKIHNKTSPANQLKLNEDTFYKLHPLFAEQMALLNKNFDLSLNWNLDKEKWVNE